ncbi:hypothetical protein NH340_JMT03543 [Sarcoptes scabiei]|nr:hypothetical protein NH340_JMT03543 [Sarcoptes scabiei]
MLVNGELVILAGNTHPRLADDICQRLGMKRTDVILYHAGNRETLLQIPSSVRFKDCYIIQTATNTNVNDAIMELLLMGYTCHTSAAKHLVGVIPYLPYGKQSRQRKRGTIAARLLAKMIGRAGFHHIVTVDLHQKEIQGFFDIPVENLRASPFLIEYIQQKMLADQIDRDRLVIVAQQTGSVRKATAYAERLKVDLAILHGTMEVETDAVDGRSSPPPVRSIEMIPGGETLPILTDYRTIRRPLKLVGEVRDKIAILVENIIDDVEQLTRLAHHLKHEEGARKVFLVATHALFSQEASFQLQFQSEFDEIVVTNTEMFYPKIIIPITVPHDIDEKKFSKIKVIDISILLTEAIRRMHNNESLSYLFTNISVED